MPTLVVLPGMDGTGQQLDGFVAALGADFPATVLTYPVAEPLNYEQLLGRLLPALPASEPFFLLGESFGGPLAIALAATRPPGLLGVVLCASFAQYPVRALRAVAALARVLPAHAAPAFALSWLLLGQWSTHTLRQDLVASVGRVPGEVLRTRLEAALRVDAFRLLASLDVPVLYLRATHDRVVPRKAGEAIVGALSRALLIEQNGPHFLLQASPEACAQHIRRFAGL